MPVSTRAASAKGFALPLAKGATSARATSARAKSAGKENGFLAKSAGKENADPRTEAATRSRPSKVKRLVKSFSDDDHECQNHDDKQELVARVARLGVQALPISLGELKGGLRKLKTSEMILDGKSETPAKESDELNDLAFLGIAGTTPGGRRWRARLKPIEKPANMQSLS